MPKGVLDVDRRRMNRRVVEYRSETNRITIDRDRNRSMRTIDEVWLWMAIRYDCGWRLDMIVDDVFPL